MSQPADETQRSQLTLCNCLTRDGTGGRTLGPIDDASFATPWVAHAFASLDCCCLAMSQDRQRHAMRQALEENAALQRRLRGVLESLTRAQQKNGDLILAVKNVHLQRKLGVEPHPVPRAPCTPGLGALHRCVRAPGAVASNGGGEGELIAWPKGRWKQSQGLGRRKDAGSVNEITGFNAARGCRVGARNHRV